MLPNIKFDVIGMKLSELSPFESPFIFRQKVLSKLVVYKEVKNGALDVKTVPNNNLRWLKVGLSDMLNHMNNNGVTHTRSRHELARYFQQWEMWR